MNDSTPARRMTTSSPYAFLSSFFSPFEAGPAGLAIRGRRLSNITAKRPRSPAIYASTQTPGTEDDDDDPELSRRVFLGAIAVTSIATAGGAYRFVIGEDVEDRIRRRFIRRFPSLFPREQTPEERRRPLNTAFAKYYYDSIEQVADKMGIISPRSLHQEEVKVQERAMSLFFNDGKSYARSFDDPSWLNFLLYSRLHVISNITSPASRRQYVDNFSRKTLDMLKTKSLRQNSDAALVNSEQWLRRLRDLLDELVSLGWISDYNIEEFDGGPGSLWQDEKRSTFTVYALDPVTMQAAQLIGEERYEEISPKVSGWLKAFLVDSGIKVSYEDYYLDNAYRPDPEQFRPTQFATQFDLSL